MGSLGVLRGGEVETVSMIRNKAMYLHPNMMAANPSERWGHSSCYFNGLLYIFGGCRGGVHFSDVLVHNLATKTWNILKTSGQGPGPRDSHTAVIVGQKMFVFGGTNGCKKVNDLDVLDLLSREWSRPKCHGNPPSPRESHTANLVSDSKLVIFGGSGSGSEGEPNYFNDLHILDIQRMEWSSPEVRGSVPAPRDSHSCVAVGNRLFVFGGDSGDRYQGDVCVLDVDNLIWSKVDTRGTGTSPGARAGHASVSIGTKVYQFGGVGDKKYYNDIWALDTITYSWNKLDLFLQKSQGKFSHTATLTNQGIAIFGGCGEDERPLNELLILQIDLLTSENKFSTRTENHLQNTILVSDNEDITTQEVEEIAFVPLPKSSFCYSSDMLHPKRRRTSNSKLMERKAETEEKSVSSSQSDHEHYPYCSKVRPLLGQRIPIHQSNPKHACGGQCMEGNSRNLIGAEVQGQVDGAFDSGYLMTATVNGKIFRGVLFAPPPPPPPPPGPDHLMMSRGVVKSNPNAGYYSRERQSRSSADNRNRASCLHLGKDSMSSSELEGVVLTLASPGSEQ